jgi:hypothetical protein
MRRNTSQSNGGMARLRDALRGARIDALRDS